MIEWIKPSVYGAIAGAVAITIVGFSADWVMTSGSATELAEQQADRAVLAALTPVCVAQFRAESQAVRTTKLAALGEESSYKQGDFVADQGWATMPGTDKANDAVADACADKLLEAAGAS
ncbi:hypothetical protein [Pikeienuella sp. HZG-20]|uniref:hypothetical protein n=1 Tax=Paludibacillus litoralis TaxID=3133267 RepID=UPI0030EBCF66